MGTHQYGKPGWPPPSSSHTEPRPRPDSRSSPPIGIPPPPERPDPGNPEHERVERPRRPGLPERRPGPRVAPLPDQPVGQGPEVGPPDPAGAGVGHEPGVPGVDGELVP